MSWNLNLLTYAVPALWAYRTERIHEPEHYLTQDKAAESRYSADIKKIIEKVLTAEKQAPSSSYQERIQQMIEELPNSVGVKDINAVVAHRFKVISKKEGEGSFVVTGTDQDTGRLEGKYFITVPPDMKPEDEAALPWIMTHEVCHILEEDMVTISCKVSIGALAATILATYVLSLSLLPSIGVVLLANAVTFAAMKYRCEKRADDFANKRCSKEEIGQGIAYLQRYHSSRNRINKIASYLLYGSEESRIARIRASLNTV